MTQKAIVVLEKEVDGKKYSFQMEIGAPYGGAYDSCFFFLQEITKMSQEAAERAKREKKEEDIVEEVEEEA